MQEWCVFWSSLSGRQRASFEAVGSHRRYRPGSALFFDNDESTHVVVVLDGWVKLTRASADGQEVVLELRGPGSLVGELAAVDHGRRIATARAVQSVSALVVTSVEFRSLLLREPELALAVLALVADKLRQATDRRVATATSDVLTRLAGRIVELAADLGPGPEGTIEIRSPLSQQEIAEWVGASRDSVVGALRILRQGGLISTARREIRVHDLNSLKQIAGHPGRTRSRVTEYRSSRHP